MYIASETAQATAPVNAPQPFYDAAIIGGGLAGLALAIQLARENYSVILVEKESYPFHRVCGEYISFECWNFLESIGYPLSDLDLPVIKHLLVSAPNGNTLEHDLPLGGFGISRYKIDAELAQIARQQGCTLRENEKVNDVHFNGTVFTLQTTGGSITARCVAGAFGKRSNLDIKWKRPFSLAKPGKLNNYIGVKYHVRLDTPAENIVLHNFSNGYCGMSRVEDNMYCLCYLTTAGNLRAAGNDIAAMEQSILCSNPHLKAIFAKASFVRKEPVTIAQVSFQQKQQVEQHMLMVGDAAGMITPLCGNGMSMALHGSKIAAACMLQFLEGRLSREEMEAAYVREWNQLFARRLRTGRFIQRMFGKTWATNVFIAVLKPFPKIIAYLIRQTHGEPF